VKKIDVPYHSSWVNDLNGGIFLLGVTRDREKVTASNGLSVWGTKAISCLILQFLGYYAAGHTNTWKSFYDGRDIINARMAIDDDLIALVTTYATPLPRHIILTSSFRRPDNPIHNAFSVIEIHLLEFPTGNPHPSATLQTLFVTRTEQEARRPGISLEILGRHLAILVTYGTHTSNLLDQLILFDWMNGTIILVFIIYLTYRLSQVFTNTVLEIPLSKVPLSRVPQCAIHGQTLLKHGGESNPWRKIVSTELPFIDTISKDPYSVSGVMIDGERIVGVEVLFLSCVYKGND
jgi:hypothetical protein